MTKALLVLFILPLAVSASAMSIPEARDFTARITAEINALDGSCNDLGPIVEKLALQLSDLGAGLNEFSPGSSENIDRALKSIDQAIAALHVGLRNCDMGDRGFENTKALLQTYLMDIDVDLMVEQHGVGEDLNRKK